METRMPAGLERRFVPAREMRVEADESVVRIAGYAGVTAAWSEDLGGFMEIIQPGAFRTAVPRSDVRLLFNHEGITLARCRGGAADGTMALEEDDTGLHFEAEMDVRSPAVQTLASAVGRGDVDKCSFSFTIAEAGDRWEDDGTMVRRTIIEFGEIYDVGPVNFPAYTDTAVALRSRDAARAAAELVRAQRRGRVGILRRRLTLEG